MDHLQDNFKDGGPVSQVPASWFNRVARFINNLVPSDTVRFEKHDDGNATIFEVAAGSRGESPTTAGSFPIDQLDTPTDDSTLWEAGGGNGANLMVLYKCTNPEIDGIHEINAARVELTSDGRISKIVSVAKSGVWIGA